MSRDPNFSDGPVRTPPPGARVGENIESQTIQIGKTPLYDCTLRDCVIEYDGDGEIYLNGCDFVDCRISLTGAAASTAVFLIFWGRLTHPNAPVLGLAQALARTPLPDNARYEG